jgi:hypothetical protein
MSMSFKVQISDSSTVYLLYCRIIICNCKLRLMARGHGYVLVPVGDGYVTSCYYIYDMSLVLALRSKAESIVIKCSEKVVEDSWYLLCVLHMYKYSRQL